LDVRRNIFSKTILDSFFSFLILDTSIDFRVIQFTPPGSGCSVIFGKNVTAAAPALGACT
jgi:hypothetical protein